MPEADGVAARRTHGVPSEHALEVLNSCGEMKQSLRTVLTRPDDLRVAQVVAVPERGWKSRIVTKHHVDLLTASHAVRELLWPALTRDVRSQEVLKGSGLSTVNEAFRTPHPVRDYQVLSSDLTAASDLLPHWLTSSLCEGIIAGTSAPAWVRETLRAST